MQTKDWSSLLWQQQTKPFVIICSEAEKILIGHVKIIKIIIYFFQVIIYFYQVFSLIPEKNITLKALQIPLGIQENKIC